MHAILTDVIISMVFACDQGSGSPCCIQLLMFLVVNTVNAVVYLCTVCEVNRPSEVCTVGGTYQRRSDVPTTVGENNMGIV